MPSRPCGRLWILLGCLCLAGAGGCGSRNPSYFPYLFPPGFIRQTHAKPSGEGYFEDFDPHAIELVVRPLSGTSPVRSERVLIATVYDEKGQPRRHRRVEWMLEGAGNIVEVDESGYLGCRGYKVDNRYAVSYTDYLEHRFTRGNNDPTDDFVIRPGQSWCVITAAVEGDTHVTVYAPEIANWQKSKVFINHHWVDAEWTFPPPAARRTGTDHTFITSVYRHTDHQPLAGYRVRYRLLDGPPAVFTRSRGPEQVAVTDLSGNAVATLAQLQPSAGVNRVAVEIIRAPDPTASSGVGIVIGQGESQVSWQAPILGMKIDSPPAPLLGQEIPCSLIVSNTGLVETRSMTVRAPIPEGVRVVRSDPPATVEGNLLVWTLGDLKGQQNRKLEVVFQPTKLGPVPLQANLVTEEGLRAESKLNIQVTQPGLKMTVGGPTSGLIGVPVTYQIKVSNPGTAPTSDVLLKASFDAGLEAPDVRANPIELKLPQPLAPGEERVVPLTLVPRQAGKLWLRLAGTGSTNLTAQGEHAVTVQDARLAIKITGPQVRYVDRPVQWDVLVSNPGQTPLIETVIRAVLPAEVEFTSASENGQLQGREVSWQVGALKAGEQKHLQLTTRCASPAEKAVLKAQASATVTGFTPAPESGPPVRAETQETLEIRGLPAFRLEVTDETDPVQVGAQTNYRIEVNNQGSLRGNQVEIVATIPPQLRVLSATGPTVYRQEGNKVIFAPKDGLEPKETWTYGIRVEALQPGDVRFKVELKAGTLSQPVVKEQSTAIYPRQ